MELNEKILDIALGEYGTIETSGPENNPDVMKYFHETGRTWVDADSTPWCDAFADWVVQKAGGQITPGLLARAWMDAGVPTTKPKRGDIVVFWRVSKDSIYGHVGFFIRKQKNVVWVLGGNQDNMVRISAYPASRVLGYRRIKA